MHEKVQPQQPHFTLHNRGLFRPSDTAVSAINVRWRWYRFAGLRHIAKRPPQINTILAIISLSPTHLQPSWRRFPDATSYRVIFGTPEPSLISGYHWETAVPLRSELS